MRLLKTSRNCYNAVLLIAAVYITVIQSGMLMAASSEPDRFEAGEVAFHRGDFAAAKAIICNYIDDDTRGLPARAYLFAMQDKKTTIAPSPELKAFIVGQSSRNSFYKALNAKLHLMGYHEESDSRKGLYDLGGIGESDEDPVRPLALYFLGLWREGKLEYPPKPANLIEAIARYQVAGSIGHVAAQERLRYLCPSGRIPPTIPAIAVGYEAMYQRFLEGRLEYRPIPGSDEGLIILLFRDLLAPLVGSANPLSGTFDLSGCGDAGNHLSINIGYKTALITANAGKTEIWICPKFLVEQELGTTASYLMPIMSQWESPVGYFWTWGDWDVETDTLDYLLNGDTMVCDKNIYEKWRSMPYVEFPKCSSRRASEVFNMQNFIVKIMGLS